MGHLIHCALVGVSPQMSDSLTRLLPFSATADRMHPRVSAWSIGAHLHHCLIATVGIAEALAASTPDAMPQRITTVGRIVLLTGRIPRGRGQAPAAALPLPEPPRAMLDQLAVAARTALERLPALSPQSWWQHHRFGVLHHRAAVRFLHLHNDHHRRIMADILSV